MASRTAQQTERVLRCRADAARYGLKYGDTHPETGRIWDSATYSSPSIDRIDSSQGYTRANCRVISMRANLLKNDATLRELELLLEDARRFSTPVQGP